PLPDPRLGEGGVLHALAARDEVTVDNMDPAVVSLDDGRVVITTAGASLQVAAPWPRPAFVLRERDGQAGTAAGRVVMDQQPVTVGQPDGVQSGAGVRQVGNANRTPGDAVVLRLGHADAPQRPILAHVGYQDA